MRISPLLTKKFMKKYLITNSQLLLLFVATSFVLSCTKVNNTLGNEVIPDKDKLAVIQDTLTDFSIYTKSIDSVRVDEFSTSYIGSYVSAKLGRVQLTYTTELQSSITTAEGDIYFKEDGNYRIDTAYIKLSVTGVIGDVNTPLTVKLYELETNFRELYNATYAEYAPEGYFDPYYSNFDYTKYIKKEPIVTFELDMQKVYENENYIIIQLPDEYVKERILKMKNEDLTDDKSFRAIHKGYSFVAEQVLTSGTIFTITPNETSAIFELTDLDDDDIESGKKKFIFDFTHLDNSELYNQVVTTIELDPQFANSTIGIPENVINDSISNFDYSYIGGLTSAMTRLKLPTDKLSELKKHLGDTPSSAIIVMNATLVVPVYDTSIGALNSSVASIATYYDYQTPTFMPDYDLLDYNFNSAIFGGFLSRSFYVYEMDITSYVQKMLSGETDIADLDLATTDYSLFENKMVKIANTKDNPIKLQLTYCVAK